MQQVTRFFTHLSRLAPFIIVISSLSVLAVFFILAQYSHPSADDYCLVSGIQEHGVFQHLWNHYLEWSGRYSGNALYGLYPLVFGIVEGYFIIPVVLIVSLGIALAYLISTIFKLNLFNFSVITASVCFVCVYILSISSTSQGFYWMAGALSYQTGNILALVLIGLSLWLYDQQNNMESYTNTLTLLIIVCIIAMGMNETVMLIILGFVSIACVLAYLSSTVCVKPWLIILSVAVMCFCIVYFAPGNDVRSSHFVKIHDIPTAINISWEYGLYSLAHWIANPVLILSSLLSLFLFSTLYSVSNREFNLTAWQVILLISLAITSPFIFSISISWSIGHPPNDRMDNTIYFFFIVFWYMSVAAIQFYIIGKVADFKFERFRYVLNILIVLMTITYVYFISTSENLTVALYDLKNNAISYDKYMNERYIAIDKSVKDGKLTLTVPGYDHEPPKSIYFADIGRDAKDWSNECYASYYGLAEIRIE